MQNKSPYDSALKKSDLSPGNEILAKIGITLRISTNHQEAVRRITTSHSIKSSNGFFQLNLIYKIFMTNEKK